MRRLPLVRRASNAPTASFFLGAATHAWLIALLAVVVMVLVVVPAPGAHGFHMIMMARRGKGNLQRSLESDGTSKGSAAVRNQGKGQEITGVTLPQVVSDWLLAGVCVCCSSVVHMRISNSMMIRLGQHHVR